MTKLLYKLKVLFACSSSCIIHRSLFLTNFHISVKILSLHFCCIVSSKKMWILNKISALINLISYVASLSDLGLSYWQMIFSYTRSGYRYFEIQWLSMSITMTKHDPYIAFMTARVYFTDNKCKFLTIRNEHSSSIASFLLVDLILD